MQRQPHRILAGRRPFDPVPLVGWDEHMVPGSQLRGFASVLKAEPGAAAKQHHPFMAILFEPFAHWSRLPVRYDALQLEAISPRQLIEYFLAAVRWDTGE